MQSDGDRRALPRPLLRACWQSGVRPVNRRRRASSISIPPSSDSRVLCSAQRKRRRAEQDSEDKSSGNNPPAHRPRPRLQHRCQCQYQYARTHHHGSRRGVTPAPLRSHAVQKETRANRGQLKGHRGLNRTGNVLMCQNTAGGGGSGSGGCGVVAPCAVDSLHRGFLQTAPRSTFELCTECRTPSTEYREAESRPGMSSHVRKPPP